MKKLCGISPGSGLFTKGLMLAMVSLFIVAIGIWFWTATAAFADEKSSDKGGSSSQVEGDTGKDSNNDHTSDHEGDHTGDHEGDHSGDHEGDKCTVCHDPHHFHEIHIPCDEVDKFLRDHPGDFRGSCTVTPSTNR